LRIAGGGIEICPFVERSGVIKTVLVGDPIAEVRMSLRFYDAQIAPRPGPTVTSAMQLPNSTGVGFGVALSAYNSCP
jgi:hypothetical protein